MTLRCPSSGPSSAKPGVGTSVIFSAALITEGLGLIDPWLLPFAAMIDAFVYDVLNGCSTDPPAMPTTAQLNPINAIGGILNPNFSTWLTACANLLKNWAWDQYCQCNTGTATPLAYPAPPTTTTIPTAGATVPCSDLQGVFTPTTEPNTGAQPGPINTRLLPCTATAQITYLSQIWTACDFGSSPPFGLTHKMQWLSGAALGGSAEIKTLCFDVNSNEILNQTLQVNNGGSGSQTFTVPAATRYIAMQLPNLANQAGDTSTWQIETIVACSQSATGPGGPCQPCTDPAVTQLLSTLLQLTTSIFQSLPGLPRSYGESTIHSGLTGNGVITLGPSAIAIRANITADTTGGLIRAGSPAYYFDRGYIVELAVEGPIRKPVRLVYNPQLFQISSVTDQIGYTLPAGLTISITELTLGP